ncbi:MAG: pyridoxal-phosphate dependent enzyme [Thermoguttaceae bacterium]|nr:pyridoxal-phosphate dependent enzyme [Thermoguttaceae bacterium]MBQ9799108.1 pyridoxal-phosphate dependent enzyme [Thermoguttaceae bacterium]
MREIEKTAKMEKEARLAADASRTPFGTPTVRLRRLFAPLGVDVLLKLESANFPSGLKDRAARAMIDAAENLGRLTSSTKIFEATSGGEGLALAFVAAARGLDLTLVAPDALSEERIRTLTTLGAKLILTPKKLGMTGALKTVADAARSDANVWVPNLFENPANVAIHETTTGPELWRDAGGRLDVFVAGVGSGGTFVGVSRYLRRKNSAIQTVAVEPVESPVLSGGRPGAHGIVGIGAGFVPKIFDFRVASVVEAVSTEEAADWTRRLARVEGIFAGISTGANLAAVAKLAERRENLGKAFATVAPDAATLPQAPEFFDDGLSQNVRRV